MDKNEKLELLYKGQQEIYELYNNDIRDAIIFIESEYHKFPVPFLNEIRAAQDHLARCLSYPLEAADWEVYVSGQLKKAKGHYDRCLLDCYKYIWYRYGSHLSRTHLIPKIFGKLQDIDNGEFFKEYKRLHKLAKDSNKEARKTETKDKEEAKNLFRDAIGYLKQMDNLFEDNYDKISWSVRKGVLLKALYALGWIISFILMFIRNANPIKSVANYILGWFGINF